MFNTTTGSVLLDVNNALGKAQIGDKMKVADLGCGASGYVVFPAANLVGKRGKVYAVDILKPILSNILKRARQESYENIEAIWSNLEIFKATKIESSSLDAAFLVNTLYQSHKRAEIIREAIRMLKKGGKLLIIEWKNVSSPIGPPIEERVNPENIKHGARKLGLELENEFEAGQYHYGMVFIKI